MDKPNEIQVGSVVRMEPVFVDGELKGFVVIDAETGEVLERVAKENVTVKRQKSPTRP
jgi:hypothetical protein